MATGLLGALVGGAAMMFAQSGGISSDPDKARIEKIVREYLLANPEILPEAMQALQAKQSGQAIAANRAKFETPYGSAWAGNPNGDVVLVEFFDYACGYCKQSNPHVARLLKEDPKLKVVWRELPVLGANSEAAAKVSLAAAKQGKFKPFFEALEKMSGPSAANVAAAAKAAGVDAKAIPADATREIEQNYELARMLNASGTPAWVIGGKPYYGAIGYDALKKAVADARKK